jgi:hypothetical protein
MGSLGSGSETATTSRAREEEERVEVNSLGSSHALMPWGFRENRL